MNKKKFFYKEKKTLDIYSNYPEVFISIVNNLDKNKISYMRPVNGLYELECGEDGLSSIVDALELDEDDYRDFISGVYPNAFFVHGSGAEKMPIKKFGDYEIPF